MIDLLNLVSVILTLIGMILPVINIMLSRKNKERNWGGLSTLSLISSAISYFTVARTQGLVEVKNN